MVPDWIQVIAVVPAMLSVLWAAVNYTLQQRAKQREERKQLLALYINPFLLACQELQSRLYNIVGDAQAGEHWNGEDTAVAEETLYLVAQYFGWERHVFRYGPYERDTEIFERTEAIRATFATNRVGTGGRRHGSEAFCFYRYQQKALAQIILESSEGPAGPDVETVAYFDFKRRYEELAQSLPSFGATLEALRSAGFPSSLRGKPHIIGRLIEVQHHLVKLLAYLEKHAEYRLYSGDRETKKRDREWIEWTARKGWGGLLGS